MLKTGMDIFFQEPAVSERKLRRSTVIANENGELTVEVDGGGLAIAEGDDVLVFFHGVREFLQQFGRVVSVSDATGAGLQALKLWLRGDPVSAESRQNQRVSMDTVDILAEVGEERALVVQDVSESGFAVVSAGRYAVGERFVVSITHDGDMFSGQAAIQSVRDLGEGRFRYGMHALVDDPEGGDLAEGLFEICQASSAGEAAVVKR